MKISEDKYYELEFENEDNNSKFFSLIKKEYINRLYSIVFWLIALLFLYFIYHILSFRYLITNVRVFFNQFVAGIFFFSFLLIHFLQLSNYKFSPKIVNFLYKELKNLDFEIQRKYKKGLGFFVFNGFTIIIFIIFNMVVSLSADYFISSLNVRFIIAFIFLSISIPPIRGVLHDKFIVKLKNSYFVQIDLQFKLIKHMEIESQMIRFYMTSNKLGSRSNHYELNLYKEISERRWLPKRGKGFFPTFQLSQYLHFQEYSAPINFKEHFLNLVSAIREWDIKIIK